MRFNNKVKKISYNRITHDYSPKRVSENYTYGLIN